MSGKDERANAVAEAIVEIQSLLAAGVSSARLDAAKRVLMRLAERRELFNHDAFPLPTDGRFERTYLIHEEPDGSCALYVNAGLPGQHSPPHDHGGAWAIVVAVDGEETHRLYSCDAKGDALTLSAEVVVRPGVGVALMPNGIHAIEAGPDATLLHLHLYAKRFEDQGERRQFNLADNSVRRFVLGDVGFIEDAR